MHNRTNPASRPLGVVAYGICLIDFPWALEAGGGTGVSVVPEMAVERHKGCRFIPIADQGAYRRVGIVQLKQHFRSRARTTFLEHLQRSAAAMS